MNYHKYYPTDVVNGKGTRASLFVSGCEHKCRGCFSKSTWSASSGKPFTKSLEDRIIQDLQDKRIKRKGLSLLGGDPLHPKNCQSILRLINRVRLESPDSDIWLWTGYTIGNLSPIQEQIALKVDVIIDGPFVEDLADPSLKWRGSSNQIMHVNNQ